MVSSRHDAAHRIFRQEPDLLARLVPETGVKFPEYSSIEPLDTDLTEIRPLERRVDSFFRVRTVDDEGGFLLAVESQTKPDPDKHNSWAYYLAHMYAKYRLPPILVVVCRDKKTAEWASEPIRIGRSFHTSMKVFPLVLGPTGVRPINGAGAGAERGLGGIHRGRPGRRSGPRTLEGTNGRVHPELPRLRQRDGGGVARGPRRRSSQG
ncbi:hypothetical protein [Streptomyces canus]|uniref:hypothetical protein n=1 Tax=Streptomyces canus TaxID=58343 RepID=UPI0036EB6DB6